MSRAELLEEEALFADYMRLSRFRLRVAAEERTVEILSGPGHDVSIVATFTLSPDGMLSAVFKGGDTRPPRTLRREPYVKIGTIGGRLDHPEMDATQIAAEEVAEEIGAEVTEGSLTMLGARASPTMPDESTEADRYYFALVTFGGRRAEGDAGGLELPGLLHPVSLGVQEALEAMDGGRIGEAARARVAYSRALSKIGYCPALGGFVEEPAWDTLGLGPVTDVRSLARPPGVLPRPTLSVGGVSILVEREIALQDGLRMLDASASHLAEEGTRLGRRFRIQFLSIPYDRAKVVLFGRDRAGRPHVHLEPRRRWGMVVKHDVLGVEEARSSARDLLDLPVPPDAPEEAVKEALSTTEVTRLGAPSDASPGQSDLRHHFFAQETEVSSSMVPLPEAIRAFRGGEGDAASEATLLRLADRLGYVPELDRTVT